MKQELQSSYEAQQFQISGHCCSAIWAEEACRLGKYRKAEKRRTTESRMRGNLTSGLMQGELEKRQARDTSKICHDNEFEGTTGRYNSENGYISSQKELRSAIPPFPGWNQQFPLK
ncbi:hypothetical protein LOZ80_09795 [Paenibacillus sp. HWE-109]|uniref:hypothetical protein n=1 Tax=Paenibacillus sp. HWE-109 TaxID=1306526 RepID=UPI001EE0A23B|nr:hypothetical protein [Paenibacillus sp. HWE-109]UKS29200.1 hypothetical protein LOZ80_09795 [Paenibacillus sp. HWE-109]